MRTSHQVYPKFSQTSKMELFGKELLAIPKNLHLRCWLGSEQASKIKVLKFFKVSNKDTTTMALTSLRFLYYLYWKNFTSSYSLCLCCYLYKFLSKEERKYIYRMKNYICNLRKQNLSKCSLAPKAHSKIIFI